MAEKKRQHSKVKSKLHPRNQHLLRYDFEKLIAVSPDLAPFVKPNKFLEDSINFFDPAAVKALNKALLKCYYEIEFWDIPTGYLCPPIPGRADYLHYLADLLFSDKEKSKSTKAFLNKGVRCLDIGVGANCIYPIIGSKEYGWAFIGSDIDQTAIENAQHIVDKNERLQGRVILRQQKNPEHILQGILLENERVELVMCNPPFHASALEAKQASQRKLKNLKGAKSAEGKRNFGGQNNELWAVGGEKEFLAKLIRESSAHATSCYWFTSLVSKESNLKFFYSQLEKVKPAEVQTIPMGQGNKTSRIIAWTFLNGKQRKAWNTLLKMNV